MTQNRQAPTGILGFPIAPFTKNNQLDEQALAQNVQDLLDDGLEAIFVACAAAEYPSLSKSEYEAMVEVAVSVTGGKVPVYTGVGGNIQTSLELAQISADKGADGYLILPPYLVTGEQEGQAAYFKAIAESTDLNAIVYQRDNVSFSISTLETLAEVPQVVGVKDGLGNMELNTLLTQTFGDRFGWLNGMPLAEVTMPAYIPLGFDSYSSAISNYIPHISRKFYTSLQNGDQETVRDIFKHVILPIHNIRCQRKGYAVSLIKAGMEIVGKPVGEHVRLPVLPVEKEHYAQMESILKNALDRFPKETAVQPIQ
ncbi:5-dehydro-4-deoxyglucarate dehydratase [Domibacillus sp. DTU_2020_1001157_1_SI_ALB_TIR_016]|uniref:5-dehydro-4-deoxyglucarate dehydratase n=1 Tax=Domibacillus sp. DTU_2020_1001157_1_SI_ALB_TIR_016 TaxID=3077789 RepID=UPI0028E51224|nr:5-dehydro-4-deoxyglucarate dehydratase [Domibacillus sp. DTU_2020_1001157_1_SI_ALB_TIR_016]WNS77753.1 5-dehydro-4-deoxyglucarate dehydratase [Domibacillus sp. DTU_2020_1001157_1_SI_ALB_TIR_016]